MGGNGNERGREWEGMGIGRGREWEGMGGDGNGREWEWEETGMGGNGNGREWECLYGKLGMGTVSGWHRDGNGIETYGNGRDCESWKPFPHTSNEEFLELNTILTLVFTSGSPALFLLARKTPRSVSVRRDLH